MMYCENLKKKFSCFCSDYSFSAHFFGKITSKIFRKITKKDILISIARTELTCLTICSEMVANIGTEFLKVCSFKQQNEL